MLKTVATFWVKVPDPQLGASTSSGGQIASLVGDESYIIAVLATFGFILAVGRLVWTSKAAQSSREIVRGLIVLTVASALTTAVFSIFLEAGNGYSDWILEQATGKNTAGDAFTAIITESITAGGGGEINNALGAWFLLFLLLILASLTQIVFMVVRGAVLYVLAVFIPVFAADSYSEEGWARFKRALMLMFAFTIYKPVAATIYATGFKLLHSPGDPNKTTASLMNGIYGITILVLASLALPSLIKFLVPMAAMGSSGAFSGGAALGAVATGAVAIGTMGASAGASGAGAAAGGGGASMAGTGGGGGGLTGGGMTGGGEGASPKGGGGSSGENSSDGGMPGGGALPGGAGGGDSGGSDDGSGIVPSDDASSAPSGGSTGAGSSGGGASTGGGGSGSGSSAGVSSTGGQESSGGAGPSGSGAMPVGAPTGGGGSSSGGSSAGGTAAQLGGQAVQQLNDMAQGAVPDGAEEVGHE
ncbi:hypothetical protein [Allobranchiibius huperziae]|uniref:TrbL/VirB6 plasmid conjugal transfer protein n=1 Tax=Allobranchiibius huperziae TaxID=1874116 RepID=A0A853DID3_9MICO|nr:hypothetical protein [Allobranchiibius huperziae]NYJ76538.1 hypothetical protein [Allobranchiibius huperziae]